MRIKAPRAKKPSHKELLNLVAEQKQAISDLEQRRDELDGKIADMAKHPLGDSHLATLLAETDCVNYRSLLQRRANDLEAGAITLSADDYFQFWTDLHSKDTIIFFKVVSRLLPKYWEEPEMKLYQRRQIDQIAEIREMVGASNYRKGSIQSCIDQSIKPMVEQVTSRFKTEKTPKGLVNRRLERFWKDPFERTFLSTPQMEQREVDLLADVMAEQADGAISIRHLCLEINEASTFDRPQDFGIVVTINGDIFGMYNDVDFLGNPLGGLVVTDREAIVHYLDSYLRLRGSTTRLSGTLSQEVVLTCVSNDRDKRNRISDPEIYGNRCEMCLQRAEGRVKEGSWEEEETPLRTWYKIVHDENEALSQLLEELKVQGPILEIGPGLGRAIDLVVSLQSRNTIPRPNMIVGYEQNEDIANSCRDKFRGLGGLVTIDTRFVGFDDRGFHGIRDPHRGSFDLILAISNIVGWQGRNDSQWIANVIDEGLHPGGRLFFTVYKDGFELERARMYKASGDITQIVYDEQTGSNQIELLVDAFRGDLHQSRAYSEEQLDSLLKDVPNHLNGNSFELESEVSEAGEYMWGVVITRRTKEIPDN